MVAKRSITLPASAARPVEASTGAVSAGTSGRALERRAPQAATQHVTWSTRNKPMVPEWDALSAIHRAYLSNVVVYRAVQVRALQVANPRIPIRVGADPSKPNDYDPSSPLLKLLDANGAVGRRQLLVQSSAQWDVTGRFAWELDLDGRRRPTMAWPLTSAYLEPIPTAGAEPEFPRGPAIAGAAPAAAPSGPRPTDYWAKYRYRITGDDGPWTELRPDQVFYAWRPSIADWRQPESVLQAARLDVSIAVMLSRYNYAFLLNDARPASVVVTQAFGEAHEFEAFKSDWEGRFAGPDNAGRPVFVEAELEDGSQADATKWLDVKTLGLSQKDAQALEMYRQALRSITVALGTPLSVLGDAADRTFANTDGEYRVFWDAMTGHFADLADHMGRRFRTLIGDNLVWFDTADVPALKAPSRFQVPVLADLIGKAVTVNEARAEVGLPPTGRPEDDQLQAPAPAEPERPPAPVVPLHAVPDVDDEAAGERDGQESDDEKAVATARRATPAGPEVRASDGADLAGVMVALWVPPLLARGLAVDGGEPPERMHVTLAYLEASATDLDAAARGRLAQLVAGWAATVPPVRAKLSGIGTFTGSNGEVLVTYASVDAPCLAETRGRLIESLDAAGLTVRKDHGFTPHITLAYGPTSADVPAAEVVFEAVTLAIGGQRASMPFTGMPEVDSESPREALRAREPASRGTEPGKTDLRAAQGAAARAAARVTQRASNAEEDRAAQWRRTDGQLRPLERLMQRQLAAFFETQEQATLSRLTDRRGRQMLRDATPDAVTPGLEIRALDPGRVFDLAFWVSRLAEMVKSLYEAIFVVGSVRVTDQFDQQVGEVAGVFDLEAPHVQETIRSRSSWLAQRVNETTFRQISDELGVGIAAGEDLDALSRRVRSVFRDASENRAEMIARTAVHGAFMEAGELAAAAMPPGLIVARTWISTPDARTRQDHRDANGQVAAMGMPFFVGDPPVAMRCPGDPTAPPEQVIRCRCVLAYETRESLEGRAIGGPHVELRRALQGLDWVAAGDVTPAGLTRILREVAA